MAELDEFVGPVRIVEEYVPSREFLDGVREERGLHRGHVRQERAREPRPSGEAVRTSVPTGPSSASIRAAVTACTDRGAVIWDPSVADRQSPKVPVRAPVSSR